MKTSYDSKINRIFNSCAVEKSSGVKNLKFAKNPSLKERLVKESKVYPVKESSMKIFNRLVKKDSPDAKITTSKFQSEAKVEKVIQIEDTKQAHRLTKSDSIKVSQDYHSTQVYEKKVPQPTAENFKLNYSQMATQLKVNKAAKENRTNKEKIQIINTYNPSSLLDVKLNDGSTNINININNISDKKDARSMMSFRYLNEDVCGPEELHFLDVERAKHNKLLAYKFDKVNFPQDDL